MSALSIEQLEKQIKTLRASHNALKKAVEQLKLESASRVAGIVKTTTREQVWRDLGHE